VPDRLDTARWPGEVHEITLFQNARFEILLPSDEHRTSAAISPRSMAQTSIENTCLLAEARLLAGAGPRKRKKPSRMRRPLLRGSGLNGEIAAVRHTWASCAARDRTR
jgi:hypothetical protein